MIVLLYFNAAPAAVGKHVKQSVTYRWAPNCWSIWLLNSPCIDKHAHMPQETTPADVEHTITIYRTKQNMDRPIRYFPVVISRKWRLLAAIHSPYHILQSYQLSRELDGWCLKRRQAFGSCGFRPEPSWECEICFFRARVPKTPPSTLTPLTTSPRSYLG